MNLQEWLAIGLLIGFFLMLMAGVPVGITLAASGFLFGFMGFGETLFHLLPARIYGVVANYQWLAIPLFVFMGVMLEKSRLAEDLLDVIGHLAGGMRGGMALGIIGVGVLMGATTGIVGATVITLGLLTLPTLLRRGYEAEIACGSDLRFGHARADHSAEPGPDPALRHPQLVGRHAVRGGGPVPGSAPRRLVRRLHRDLRHGQARCDAARAQGRARRAVAPRALAKRVRQGGAAAGGTGRCRCSARSSPALPRRPRPPRWAGSAPS